MYRPGNQASSLKATERHDVRIEDRLLRGDEVLERAQVLLARKTRNGRVVRDLARGVSEHPGESSPYVVGCLLPVGVWW